MNREELKLENDHLDLLDALAAAKAAYRDQPTADNKATLEAAKLALLEFRTYWREVRTAFNPGATVPTLSVKAKV